MYHIGSQVLMVNQQKKNTMVTLRGNVKPTPNMKQP